LTAKARNALVLCGAIVLLVALAIFLRSARKASVSHPSASRAEVVSWIRSHAIPVSIDAAGGAFVDAGLLTGLIGSARVVGVGEATHGTSEFFRFKARLFEFLVEEMSFTVIGVEASWSDSLAVDDFVRDGTGDPEAAVLGMKFWTIGTEEVLELVRWMRAYNADPRHERKLRFAGFDMQSVEEPSRRLAAYLKDVDPAVGHDELATLETLATVDTLPDRSRAAEICARSILPVADLGRRLSERKAQYVARSGHAGWRRAVGCARILGQAIQLHGVGNSRRIRDQKMAENVEWILNEEGLGTRMMLWAHNSHVSAAPENGGPWSMGSHLRETFGSRYFVIGQAFGEGGFVARDGQDSGQPSGGGRLGPFAVGPAEPGSLDGTLAATGVSAFVVPVGEKAGSAGRWLHSAQTMRAIGSTFSGEGKMGRVIVPAIDYDAIAFFQKTTPARPLLLKR
jgi:erythromycin esterase